mmetsp:Transcript_33253/g.84986  ORF Transcript_33253/g.84986 Transcript_33253/m.84986 type:complete len:208 (+) Transcript_33253:116-739(+)
MCECVAAGHGPPDAAADEVWGHGHEAEACGCSVPVQRAGHARAGDAVALRACGLHLVRDARDAGYRRAAQGGRLREARRGLRCGGGAPQRPGHVAWRPLPAPGRWPRVAVRLEAQRRHPVREAAGRRCGRVGVGQAARERGRGAGEGPGGGGGRRARGGSQGPRRPSPSRSRGRRRCPSPPRPRPGHRSPLGRSWSRTRRVSEHACH